MHGRLKVRTSEEQCALKLKEQQKKLAKYQAGVELILANRKANSYDNESLYVCTNILLVNPDIYTLWNYRKEVILIEKDNSDKDNGNKDGFIKFLEDELKFTEQCLVANPKSYGTWHHRYWILLNHPKPNWTNEFNLCSKYLSIDDRNFHCWDYRRLLVSKIGITLSEELEFSKERLNANFSNYSSWHYRSTLRELDSESADYELNLVLNALFTDPYDSSAWFYLRWVLSSPAVKDENKTQFLDMLQQLGAMEINCKWIVLAKCWILNSISGGGDKLERTSEYFKKCLELDPTRRGYYQDYFNIGEGNSNEIGDKGF